MNNFDRGFFPQLHIRPRWKVQLCGQVKTRSGQEFYFLGGGAEKKKKFLSFSLYLIDDLGRLSFIYSYVREEGI